MKASTITHVNLGLEVVQDRFPLQFLCRGEEPVLRSPLDVGQDDRLKGLRARGVTESSSVSSASSPRRKLQNHTLTNEKLTSSGLSLACLPVAFSSARTRFRTLLLWHTSVAQSRSSTFCLPGPSNSGSAARS